jgi:hypothetical protein
MPEETTHRLTDKVRSSLSADKRHSVILENFTY